MRRGKKFEISQYFVSVCEKYLELSIFQNKMLPQLMIQIITGKAVSVFGSNLTKPMEEENPEMQENKMSLENSCFRFSRGLECFCRRN